MAKRFRELSDLELDQLDDGALLAQLVAAREHGALEQATLALAIFVYRLEPLVVARVAAKVPVSEVDHVVGEVFDSVMSQSFEPDRSPWEGSSEASLRAWINTIVRRRIADRTRSPRPRLDPLPEDNRDDPDVIGGDAGIELDRAGEVAVMDLAERCLTELSDAHAEAVWLAVFEDLSSKQVAERINASGYDLDQPMSDTNVDKIKSRFRQRLGELLAEGDD